MKTPHGWGTKPSFVSGHSCDSCPFVGHFFTPRYDL